MNYYNCLLLPNDKKDVGLKLTKRIARYLHTKGSTAYVPQEIFETLADEPVKTYDPESDIPIDLIIPLGGDGTIIGAIRRLKDLTVPILGINLGGIGYLAEVEPDQAEKALGMVLEGHYATEDRILLEGWIEKRSGGEPVRFTAMNEVLINRHMMASLIEMRVCINGHLIDSFLGDGLIVCTPTGSTAYNLSAGGPIVAPTARNLVITPLCVHSLNVRSIVTSENDVITVELGNGKNNGQYESLVNIDGQKKIWMEAGDKIVLRRSSRTASIIKVTEHTFYQTLKKKLF